MLYLSGVVRPDMPAMVTPRMRQRPPEGQPWAADNGRYSAPQDYSDETYLAWLARMPAESCLFATAPDSFGDAAGTLRDSLPMLPRIRRLGYAAALVAQPWMAAGEVPWGELDVLFVGGPNVWQHSEQLIELVTEAKRRGKWVHMGRVNSLRRMAYAESIGCDSADGTVLRFDPDRDVQAWARHVRARPSLWPRPTDTTAAHDRALPPERRQPIPGRRGLPWAADPGRYPRPGVSPGDDTAPTDGHPGP